MGDINKLAERRLSDLPLQEGNSNVPITPGTWEHLMTIHIVEIN